MHLPSARPTVRCRHDRLPGRIESKVSLVHELLIETRINRGVVVLDRVGWGWGSCRVDLCRPILEQLV